MHLQVASSLEYNTLRNIYVGIFHRNLVHMGYFSSMADVTFSTYCNFMLQMLHIILCLGKLLNIHCVKSVLIRSFSGPYFPAFGLNTKRYSVCRTRKTPNTDTFYAVMFLLFDLEDLSESHICFHFTDVGMPSSKTKSVCHNFCMFEFLE